MRRVFKTIKQLEVRHLSYKHRRSTWYLIAKIVLLFPLIAVGALELGVMRLVAKIKSSRIKRNGKPDIVFSNIVAGFTGLAFPNEKTEVLAKRRAEICAQCPSAVESGLYTAIVDNRTTQIQGMKCDECGCSLSAKVRSSKDYCPLGKW